jgi:hypothetical protein
MKALGSLETSGTTNPAAKHQIPEGLNALKYRCENPKPRNCNIILI